MVNDCCMNLRMMLGHTRVSRDVRTMVLLYCLLFVVTLCRCDVTVSEAAVDDEWMLAVGGQRVRHASSSVSQQQQQHHMNSEELLSSLPDAAADAGQLPPIDSTTTPETADKTSWSDGDDIGSTDEMEEWNEEGQETTTASPVHLEKLVRTLRTQLKDSQATHMHARSIINVMQEKQESHERDMAVLKDDLTRLKHELNIERDNINVLRAHTADSAWAITDVKRGQDQVASDLVVLKRQQELQNETQLVIQDIIMSNALELVTHNKYAAAVRHDIASLQTQAVQDRDHTRLLHETLQRHLAVAHPTTNTHSSWEVNSIDNDSENDDEDADDDNGNYQNHVHQQQQQRRPEQYEKQELRSSGGTMVPGGRRVGDDSTDQQSAGRKTDANQQIQTELSSQQTQLDEFNKELSQLKEQLTVVESRLSRPSQEGITIALGAELLQQAFINFTRQIYRLEDEWKQQVSHSSPGNIQNQQPQQQQQHSHSSSSNQLFYTTTLNEHLTALNVSLSELRLRSDNDRLQTETTVRSVEELRTVFEGWDDRSRHLEVMLLNGSLEQCRRTSVELAEELKVARLADRLTRVENKLIQEEEVVSRAELAVSEVYTELRKHTDTLTSLSKQAKLTRHLPTDFNVVKADLLNVVSQLPEDCSMAVSDPVSRDGVYLIRSGATISRTARVYCQRDTRDGTAWTVIQRRSDGRVSFARTWDEYRVGFGEPSSEYWLGNEYISRITSQRPYRLQIDMWDIQGRYWSAEYGTFRVRSEDELYRLDLGSSVPHASDNRVGSSGETPGKKGVQFSGNVSDSLQYSDRQPFSAIDRDNDVSTTDCARFYAAGWWYKHCHYVNLNGRYTAGVVWFNEARDEWLQLRQTVMKIAPSLTATAPTTTTTTAVTSTTTTTTSLSSDETKNSQNASNRRRHKVKPHKSTGAVGRPPTVTTLLP